MYSTANPNKYKHATRLGNWSEEWELEEIRKKDYLRRKANKTLPSHLLEESLLKSYQPASLTYSRDGLLRFGDRLMLYNGKTQGFLDTFKNILNTQQRYYASTVLGLHACARSVFIIERANPKDGFPDNVVHFGQELKLRVNPLLEGPDKPLYLHSQHQNDRKFSEKSRMQEVVWALKDTYDMYNVVWSFEDPDYTQRLESEGEEVKMAYNVILKHNFTNRWLASDVIQYQNFFGKQFEVMVNNYFLNSKTQVLKNEKEGKTTIDFAQKGQKLENLWVIVGATDPSQQFDQSIIKKVGSIQNLLSKVKYLLSEKGVYGLRFLSKVFQNIDTNKVGVLDPEDFMWGLKSAKIYLDFEQFQVVLKSFGPQKIAYSKFVQALRGPLSEKRKAIIEAAFSIAAKKSGGAERITVEELGKWVDAKKHPEVLKGVRKESEVFNEFVAHWNRVEPDVVISQRQFVEYYWDISATIPKDDHFEFMMLSIWHI